MNARPKWMAPLKSLLYAGAKAMRRYLVLASLAVGVFILSGCAPYTVRTTRGNIPAYSRPTIGTDGYVEFDNAAGRRQAIDRDRVIGWNEN